MTMTNDTDIFIDFLDGDNMACQPNGDEDYRFVCFYSMHIIGPLHLACGLWAMLIAFWNARLSWQVSAQINSQVCEEKTRAVRVMQSKVDKRHGFKLALVHGINVAAAGLFSIIGGYGTAFPTTHPRGMIGDLFGAIYMCSHWNLALMQVQGAKWFQSLVNLQACESPISRGKFKRMLVLPSLCQILNMLQGPLGPAIALMLWVLTVVGVLPRTWLNVTCFSLDGLFGVRSLVAITTQRVDGIRRVAAVQRCIHTPEDKKRGGRILKGKALGLVLDVLGVGSMHVLLPFTVLLWRSSFSSRQQIVHYAALLTPGTIVVIMTNANLHSKVLHLREKRRGELKMINPTLGAGNELETKSQKTEGSQVGRIIHQSDV